jgi:hypothetical protein
MDFAAADCPFQHLWQELKLNSPGYAKKSKLSLDPRPITATLRASQDKSGLIEPPTGFWVFPGDANEAAFFVPFFWVFLGFFGFF